ncbi:DUF3667 domain-containing protein [Dysgonomonas reticulitermitis]
MSKHKIRRSKTCQNCGSFVEKNYCPDCGQENSESRHSFHHLFTHFVSDFLHYDSSFWRTTKTLFLSPGKISLEYMSGKRKSYVNPFSYYIFISFLTFFIPFMLTYPDKAKNNAEFRVELEEEAAIKDSIVAADREAVENTKGSLLRVKGIDRNSSLYKTINKNLKDEESKKKASEFFTHNLPKALFVYMPIFAFWMWLFHKRKKRYYFDSGIFTLHFFSVALLSITICILFDWIFAWLNWKVPKVLLWFLLIIYITFYFFRGNRVFYGEPRFKSNLKAFFLMGINTFFIFIVLLGYIIFIAYKIDT